MNRDQVQLIYDKLKRFLPEVWEGKESIQYMKDNGCHHWKQMEWPGFYFQFMCETILGDEDFMDIPGPRYGNVEFDGFRFIPWDFKAHSIDPVRGDVGKIPTNGYQETMQAIREYGEVCFIIASRFDYHKFYKLRYLVLGISILLLVLVFVPGVSISANGARRWIGFGGFNLQSSEVAKFGFVIFTACYLSKNY